MPEYKIARISQGEPREYYNERYKTTTYYIKVMLEGHSKPVSIGKRSPDALKVGDTVYGTILPTEYKTDNFKLDPKPNPAFPAKDQSEIKAQWAIGQAVALFTSGKDTEIKDIEKNAKDFFAMVERVKNGEVEKKTTVDRVKETFSDGTPVVFDEPINLDEIPF